ncbi:hypothetical protein tb265_00750 [Gemmatimonadetes bacterium T265]|nr:hypothetical protein tb265_00750 [Gemmatimonadetes bacterium T265]
MTRWSDRARAATAGVACVGVVLGAATAGAQTPAARDTARRDTTHADTARRPVTDSTARDSIVAGQLRAAARRPERSIFEQLRLDRLRLTEIGFAGGVVFPDQVRSTTLYALHADYGEIVPNFRVVAGVTYWTSRYTDEAVAGFERALGRALGGGRGPQAGGAGAGGAPVQVGSVRSSDVALNAETRWRPRVLGGHRPAERVRPWVALGAGAHFLNVQNPTIDGTFVSRALDGVAFGPTGALGVDLLPLRAVHLSAEARYDLFNGARYGSLRAGGSYAFERRGGG